MGIKKFKFLRAKSMSEEKTPAMEEVEKKKRPATVPCTAHDDDYELPIQDVARLAIENLPAEQKKVFDRITSQPLTEFKLFPDLKVEMRKKIFRMLFPDDREIRLRVQYKHGDYVKEDFGLPLPVTFSINRESRAESFKYYYIYSQGYDTFQGISTVVKNPFTYCINPNLDRISVGFRSIIDHTYSALLKGMSTQIRNCMRQIRVVDVVDFYEMPFVTQADNHQRVMNLLVSNIAAFHHLHELRFISEGDLESAFVHTWKQKILSAFLFERQAYPGCKLPKIICTSRKVWEAMKAMGLEHRV